ncbi:MAG: hypothetical protein ACE5FC_09490 [Myxococcota bacterium]
MELKKVILASAVAGLFIAGGAVKAHAEDAAGGAQAEKIHCDGVNACKGQSECKTATNDCAGQNACKGKGFVAMTQEECDAAKATAAE